MISMLYRHLERSKVTLGEIPTWLYQFCPSIGAPVLDQTQCMALFGKLKLSQAEALQDHKHVPLEACKVLPLSGNRMRLPWWGSIKCEPHSYGHAPIAPWKSTILLVINRLHVVSKSWWLKSFPECWGWGYPETFKHSIFPHFHPPNASKIQRGTPKNGQVQKQNHLRNSKMTKIAKMANPHNFTGRM